MVINCEGFSLTKEPEGMGLKNEIDSLCPLPAICQQTHSDLWAPPFKIDLSSQKVSSTIYYFLKFLFDQAPKIHDGEYVK